MYNNRPVITIWCFDTKYQLVLPSTNVSEILPISTYWRLWQRRGLARPLLIIHQFPQDTYALEEVVFSVEDERKFHHHHQEHESQEHEHHHYQYDLQLCRFWCTRMANYLWKNKTLKKTEPHDKNSILLGQDAASLEGNPRISAVENSKLTTSHYVPRHNSCVIVIT